MKFLLKNKRLVPAIWLISFISLGGFAYWKFYLKPRPNIILITIDTLRQDHLSYDGYKRETTPNIDKLGNQGIIFLQATSFSDWTMPSHENLLTGRYPISSITKYVPSSSKFLPEILRQYGYRTAAFISGLWLKKQFGLNQGFDLFDDDFPGGGRNIENYYHAILEWLDTEAKEPFFLWLHLIEPHFPYVLHDRYTYEPNQPTDFDKYNEYFGTEEDMQVLRENKVNLGEKDIERAKALYDSEISYTDGYLGRFWEDLKKRGLLDKSMIIITSDHGEGFGEHGMYFTHGYDITEEITRVPMLIKMPGNSPGGKIISSQVQASDIFSTVLDTANIRYKRSLLSKSLLPLIKGSSKPIRKYAYSYSSREQRYSVRDGRSKLIYSDKNGSYALYDTEKDRWETTDIKDENPARLQEMKQELDTFKNGFSLFAAKHSGVKPPPIAEETKKNLWPSAIFIEIS